MINAYPLCNFWGHNKVIDDLSNPFEALRVPEHDDIRTCLD